MDCIHSMVYILKDNQVASRDSVRMNRKNVKIDDINVVMNLKSTTKKNAFAFRIHSMI